MIVVWDVLRPSSGKWWLISWTNQTSNIHPIASPTLAIVKTALKSWVFSSAQNGFIWNLGISIEMASFHSCFREDSLPRPPASVWNWVWGPQPADFPRFFRDLHGGRGQKTQVSKCWVVQIEQIEIPGCKKDWQKSKEFFWKHQTTWGQSCKQNKPLVFDS